MSNEDGRVILLPKQIDRLAELRQESTAAVEVAQRGSVLYLYNGQTKLTINANGEDIHPPNQDSFC